MPRYIAFLLFLLFAASLVGCSTTREIELDKSNLQRQMAMQKHLQSLNNQNEQLKKSLTESSSLNSENGELLNKSLMTENTPELQQLLNEYKQVTQKTQLTLDSIKRSIDDDTEKNAYLLEMLDGFSPQDDEQEIRLDNMETALGAEKKKKRYADNIHIGISPQHMVGSSTFIADNTDEESTYEFSGTASGAYFTYAGDNNAAIGVRYMTLTGNMEPEKEISGIDHLTVDGYLGMVSLGFRINVGMFNIIPEITYGIGENTYGICETSSCSKDDYYKTNIAAYGMEIPFYHQLSVAFSWGFKLTGYKISSSESEKYLNGSKVDDDGFKTDATYAGLGLMAGLAW